MDITICVNDKCEKRKTCKRHSGNIRTEKINSDWQSYSTFEINGIDIKDCEYYQT